MACLCCSNWGISLCLNILVIYSVLCLLGFLIKKGVVIADWSDADLKYGSFYKGYFFASA